MEEAAEAIAEGRTAVVAEVDLPAFQAVLGRRDMRARAVARIAGANYSNSDETVLTIFRPASEDTP